MQSKTGFPIAGGKLGELIRAFDWAATSLGPIDQWPPHLKGAVSLMLPAEAQIVLFWGPDHVALYNDAYAPTIGSKHPRALGRPARENWAELWDDLEPLLRRVLHTGQTVSAKDRPFHIERSGYPEEVYFDISYSAVLSETGEVGGVLCIVSETTERVVAQRELGRAQERLHQALSASGMIGTFDWHVPTDMFYSDARFARMFSVDPARGEKGAPLAEYLSGIHTEDLQRITRAVNDAVRTGKKYTQEYRLREKNGTVRWVEARGECLYDENGQPSRFVGVVVDITIQKEAQERQSLLAREATHRVKNMFAVFQSIISMSARSANTPQDMATSLRGRLDALMRAKDLVRPGIIGHQAHRERTTVGEVVRTILEPHDNGTDGRIVAIGPEVSVGPSTVTSLALALHETATNAAKYGSLSEPNGTVQVMWKADGDRFELVWEENGGPPLVSPPQAQGFGTQLTERTITGQLSGEIQYHWMRSGLKLTMAVPLERLEE